MALSMTGFGQASFLLGTRALRVEVKSVNHRYFKVATKLPEILNPCEAALEAQIKKQLRRGSIQFRIRYTPQDEKQDAGDYKFQVKLGKAKAYWNALGQLADGFGFPLEDYDLTRLAQLSGIIEEVQPTFDRAELFENASEALAQALDACNQMRIAEGKSLAEDLSKRCEVLVQLNEQAKKRAPHVVLNYKKRLEDRIAQLLDPGQDFDPESISREVALFADRCDVSEELTRFSHHCMSMAKLLGGKKESEIGRELDFIAQEMLREANTMSNKANDIELTQLALQMKLEIEKIKEQVQNVE